MLGYSEFVVIWSSFIKSKEDSMDIYWPENKVPLCWLDAVAAD